RLGDDRLVRRSPTLEVVIERGEVGRRQAAERCFDPKSRFHAQPPVIFRKRVRPWSAPPRIEEPVEGLEDCGFPGVVGTQDQIALPRTPLQTLVRPEPLDDQSAYMHVTRPHARASDYRCC